MKLDYSFLDVMRGYLEERGELISATPAALDRLNGKTVDFSTHVKYMIYAQLSNQEKWENVEKHLPEIDDVLFHYDVKKIKEQPWEYFYGKIKLLVSRGLSLEGQMKNLHENITTLEKIDRRYGGLDKFVVSKPPRQIIEDFTTTNKLKYMGISLVCEYLKNVGVQCAKPDTHIMRFLSKTRRGFLDKPEETAWSDGDKLHALQIIENMSEASGKSPLDIDRIIWSFCATDYGEICTKTPQCGICPVKAGCRRCQ